MKPRFIALAAGLLLAGGLASAADWPQWRGPDRDGHSRETGLLKSFPDGGPRLLWTFDKAGIGFSATAVVGGKAFSLGDDGRSEYVFALDATTGKELWRTTIGSNFNNQNGSGPRCTPTVDGDALYVLSPNGDLACLEVADGKVRWKTNLARDLRGRMMSGWGYTESVLIDGDQLVCSPGGDGGMLAAFDKKTGKVLWRSTGLSSAASHSSIVISEGGGVRQYVQLTSNGVAGFSPKDGKVLWQKTMQGFRTAVIPTPIISDDYVYVTSSYGAGCGVMKLAGDGSGGVKAETVYTNKMIDNHHGGVVRVGDHVYGTHGNINGKASLPLVCQELKTGKEVWRHNLEPSSLIFADGHLYCYGQVTGALVCIEASPKGYVEKGRFKIPKQTSLRKPNMSIWAHPVIADGKLFLRDQDLLFCFDLRETKTNP